MYNKIILLVVLSHFFWLSSFAQCFPYSTGIYCINIDAAMLEIEMPKIERYFDKTSYFGDNLEHRDSALSYINARMNNLFEASTMINLDAGTLDRTGLDTTNNIKQIDLRWTNPIFGAEYFTGYMNLLTAEAIDNDPIPEPGVRLIMPVTTRGYLFTFNALSSAGQGSYNIIIVDRDINFSEFDRTFGSTSGAHQGNSGSNILSPSMFQDNSFNSLNVFPNPIKESNFNINFQLSEDQNISIQLIQASSGRLVETIRSKQFLKKGDHSIIVENENLVAGIYFIVLQTDSLSRVEKLVKIK